MPIQPRSPSRRLNAADMTAEIAIRHPEPCRQLPGDKLANLGPQRLAFGRQLDRIETEGGAHRSPTIRAPRPTLQPLHLLPSVAPSEAPRAVYGAVFSVRYQLGRLASNLAIASSAPTATICPPACSKIRLSDSKPRRNRLVSGNGESAAARNSLNISRLCSWISAGRPDFTSSNWTIRFRTLSTN